MLFSWNRGLRAIGVAAAVLGAMIVAAAQLHADELDALKGKTIRVVVGSSAGSTSDTAGRVFFGSLRELLPDTTIRFQNVGGGGGANAVKELQEADGSLVSVAIFNYGPLYSQLLATEVSAYDLKDLQWIGSLARVERLLAMRTELGSTLDALRSLDRQPVIATSAAFSPSTIESLLLNAILDLRMKVVPGTSDPQQEAMLLSGNVDAAVGDPAKFAPYFESGTLVPIVRFGSETVLASHKDVPALADVVPATVPQDLLFLMETFDKSGRLVAAAPATDPEVVAALRAAFDKTVANEAYKEAMAKANITTNPTNGAEVSQRVEKMLGSPEMKDLIQSYMACGQKLSDGATSCK
jgi:tripartite-type tricarboxylate transporter receptor subunit TctC